ncbi:MAG: acetamidase/formamidase family protein [Halobacteriales archaeon]
MADHDVDHRLTSDPESDHRVWNNDHEPVLTVDPPAVVELECPDANGGDVTPATTAADLRGAEFPGHLLTGPIAVEGARPGDVLEVELLSISHRGYGYTIVPPGESGGGLLPGEFPEPAIHHWDLDGEVGKFVAGIEVPLAPFPGTIGVAPARDGDLPTTPPRAVGGNMDVTALTEGATLYLPVEVAGALFSVGDGHAAQGNGEVCLTAIEAPLELTARLDIRDDIDIDQPRLRSADPPVTEGPTFATTGIAPDLMDGAKKAIRGMIDHLTANYDLSRTEAYMLCSVTVDLQINEVVNEPNWVVSAHVPERPLEPARTDK